MGPEFLKKALLNSTVKEKELEPYSENNNTGLFRGGATFADAITFGADKVDKKLLEEFSKVRGKKVIPYREDSDLTEYLQLYGDLANK
jgi:starch synthase